MTSCVNRFSAQGSTTVLWQQQSFWDRRPSSSNEVLPLFVEKGLSVLGAALGAATGSTAETQTACMGKGLSVLGAALGAATGSTAEAQTAKFAGVCGV
eukprot:1156149-Pelagomonas_calceolata.AAC.6